MLIIKNSVEQLSIRFVPHCQLKISLPDCSIHGPEEHKRLHRLEMVATIQGNSNLHMVQLEKLSSLSENILRSYDLIENEERCE